MFMTKVFKTMQEARQTCPNAIYIEKGLTRMPLGGRVYAGKGYCIIAVEASLYSLEVLRYDRAQAQKGSVSARWINIRGESPVRKSLVSKWARSDSKLQRVLVRSDIVGIEC